MKTSPRLPGPPSAKESLAPERLTRRRFLQGAMAGGVTAAFLAGCERNGREARLVDWDLWWSQRRPTGQLTFANWPYYIDRHFSHRPSLERFMRESGVKVEYLRPIRSNEDFFNDIRPALAAGRQIGYDLICITNGPQLNRMLNNGWLTPLDHSRLPNFSQNAGPLVRDPSWDPGNVYTVAWQSGITGIAYRPEAVEALGHRPRSVHDLLDPALLGRVGMFTDLMDLGSFGLLAAGVDPASSSWGDWRAAAQILQGQNSGGLVHRHYDQGYVGALRRGDIWISQGWSGDIFQLNLTGHPEIGFVVPREGGMLWTDNLMIPRSAANPLEAMTYMDYVYQPHIAAMIADWVQYITPVPSSRRIIAHKFDDPTVANSPFVFPEAASGDSGITDRLFSYPTFADDLDERIWFETFGPIASATL